VHFADLDNDGVPDRIVITADRDLKIQDIQGSGHYSLRVRLSSNGEVLKRRLYTRDYVDFVHRRWSPWFGAAVLDHVGGKEILLGSFSGASSDEFHVLAYTEGRLVSLPAPDAGGWDFNDTVDQSNGFRCTSSGIESRFYYQSTRSQNRWVVGRDYFVWRDERWVHTHGSRQHVSDRGGPPAGTARFGQFRCPGLDG
jgi:hypothetical protein